jgi:hypothetical protein
MIKIDIKKLSSIGILSSFFGVISIYWQTVFYGRLPGDLLDARFTVIVNEHWFKVATGQNNVANLNFYYPTQNQLGFSDAFFASGIIAIPFRFAGIDPVNSWIIANLLLALLCLIFAYQLFEDLFKSKLSASIMVVLSAVSYPFLAQIGHAQTIGYLLLFPIMFFTRKLYLSSERGHFKNLCILMILIEILALSAWYAFVFLTLLLISSALIGVFLLTPMIFWSQLKLFLGSTINNLRNTTLSLKLVGVVSVLPLLFLWIYIYLQTAKYSSDKPYSGFIFYAPRWGDLFNSSTHAWGHQLKINEYLHQTSGPTFERALGLTPIFAFVLVLIPLVIRLKSLKQSTSHKFQTKLIYIVSVLFILVIVVDELGHSFWRFLWITFPPIRSITVPFRIMIVISWLLIYVILIQIQSFKRKTLLTLVISSLLLIDFWRPTMARWNSNEFIRDEAIPIVSALKNNSCDAFFINPAKGDPAPWLTQVDAMALGMVSNIPTVNGYSGNWPNGWPITPYWGGATPESVTTWIRENSSKSNLRFCYFNGTKEPHKPDIIVVK